MKGQASARQLFLYRLFCLWVPVFTFNPFWFPYMLSTLNSSRIAEFERTISYQPESWLIERATTPGPVVLKLWALRRVILHIFELLFFHLLHMNDDTFLARLLGEWNDATLTEKLFINIFSLSHFSLSHPLLSSQFFSYGSISTLFF